MDTSLAMFVSIAVLLSTTIQKNMIGNSWIQWTGTNVHDVIKFCPRAYYYDYGRGEGQELFYPDDSGKDIRVPIGWYLVKKDDVFSLHKTL